MRLPITTFLSILVFAAPTLFAQENSQISPLADPEPDAKPVEAESVQPVSVGTKAFDADTVNELFSEYKAENERRAEQEAPHLNFENLEVIELAPVNAQAYEVRNLDDLIDRIDPQPRRRLERLAELDPQAAADIRVTARSEERFFAGENDPVSDMNAGSTANVDFRKVGESVSAVLEKAKGAMRKKKVTDDQAALPVGE